MLLVRLLSFLPSHSFPSGRGLYFALPASVTSNTPSISIAVFEVPSLLFFLLYTTTIYIWYPLSI